MTNTIKKSNILIYGGVIGLILLSNYLLYHLPIMQPVPNGAALGSIFDLMLVIPILTYFMVIRKRYSLKYIGLVILAGYGAAYFIIPNEHLQHYSFIHWIVGLSEGTLILVELYILYKVVTKLPVLIRDYKIIRNQNSYFQYNLRNTIDQHFPHNSLFHVFLSELALFYYSLFSWRSRVNVSSGLTFTYHTKTSTIAVYILLIHAIVLESVGFHYLLHSWNPILAYIFLFFNVYGVLYFLAEIQATRLTPFLLTEETLYLQVGFSKSMEIPIELIKEIKLYDGPEKISRHDAKLLFDARAADFIVEKPMFEILLAETINVRLLYGLKSRANRVLLNVDHPNEFSHALQTILKERNS